MKIKKLFLPILLLMLTELVAFSIPLNTDIDIALDVQAALPLGTFNSVTNTGTGFEFKLIYNSYQQFNLNFNMSYVQWNASRFSGIKIIVIAITPAIQYIILEKEQYALYSTAGLSLISEEVKAEAGENYTYYGISLGIGMTKKIKGRIYLMNELNLVLIQDLNHLKFSIGVLYDFK